MPRGRPKKMMTEEDLNLESPVMLSSDGSLGEPEPEQPSARSSTRGGAARHFTASKSRRSTVRRGRPPASDKIGQIKNSVQETVVLVGMGLQVGMPLTGLVVVNRADKMGEELAILAERNPAVRRILERLVLVSGFATLGFVVKDVVVAAGVERGVIATDHPLAGSIQEEIKIVVEVQQRAAAIAQAAAAQTQQTPEVAVA